MQLLLLEACNPCWSRSESGRKAPDFKLLDNSLAEKTLKDYEGKIKVISVVPSLDTGVCDAQTVGSIRT